jgi:hypothetical protein
MVMSLFLPLQAGADFHGSLQSFTKHGFLTFLKFENNPAKKPTGLFLM